MVVVYGRAIFGGRADEDGLRAAIPEQWLKAWDGAHGGIGRYEARVASLTGLWLLAESGAEGELSYGKNGKPTLTGHEISITHTSRYVFCAVAREGNRIGLDAEDIDGARHATKREAMADRWYGERERRYAKESEEAFLRVWTRKEAHVKLTGEGLRGLRRHDSEENEGKYWEGRIEETLITLLQEGEEEVRLEIRESDRSPR